MPFDPSQQQTSKRLLPLLHFVVELSIAGHLRLRELFLRPIGVEKRYRSFLGSTLDRNSTSRGLVVPYAAWSEQDLGVGRKGGNDLQERKKENEGGPGPRV